MFQREKTSGRMHAEGVAFEALAETYGTPLFVYSKRGLLGNFQRIQDAFPDALVAYAMKSNSNLSILRLLVNAGAGLDVVSGGELARGLAAGVDPQKVIFAGVGKTDGEIALALGAGILAFNVESEAEAEAIAEGAGRQKRRATICIRVNPNVDAATHHYISTGKKEHKFGVPYEGVRKLMKRLARHKQLETAGVHCHIGSQILKPEGHVEALGRVAELIGLLRRDGHPVRLLNMGGGFGIAYQDDQHPFDVAAFAARVLPVLKQLDVRLILEPGRSVSGPAGALLSRLVYVKPGEARNFAIVDAAMNDLIRPSLYSAYHRIEPVDRPRRGAKKTYDVVGPICESGDFLGKERELAPLKRGDLLLIRDAGAYGMAMASNYNSRPRAAEVMVDGTEHALIRRRETIDDLLGPERTAAFKNGTARGRK